MSTVSAGFRLLVYLTVTGLNAGVALLGLRLFDGDDLLTMMCGLLLIIVGGSIAAVGVIGAIGYGAMGACSGRGAAGELSDTDR